MPHAIVNLLCMYAQTRLCTTSTNFDNQTPKNKLLYLSANTQKPNVYQKTA
jgi:hypothetical protein